MTWMDRMSALLARKSSRAGAAVAAVGLAPARWTPRRYDRLAEEGYRKNVVAYRCVREVARACASVPWLLYTGSHEVDQHPLLDLLRRPNPRQSGPELIEAAIGHLLLSGNAYLEVARPDGEIPRELYALRPDRMRIVPDVSGVPQAYRYEVEGRSVDWPVDPISGASDVLHLRDFHPLDDWYGLSPIEAAAAAIDQHNAAAEHNAALLQNGARPSGALVFRSDPGPDGIRRVEEALLDRTQGPWQAGRPLVLGGDVDWKELGFSPKDMDFAELKAQAAREIAAAFGVPHLLVVSGEATYSNRADARLELWEHTVIPLLDRLSSALSSWLGPMFGENLRLAHDLDEVPALAPRRRLKWQQIQQADILTLNEKRQALGYVPVKIGEGKREQKNSEHFRRLHGYEQPRSPAGDPHGGRWSKPPIRTRESAAMPAIARDDDLTDVLVRIGVTGLSGPQMEAVKELYRILRDNFPEVAAAEEFLRLLRPSEFSAAAKSWQDPPKTLKELRPDVEPRGFNTVKQLNDYLDETIGKTPPGYERHHIIPQHQTRPEYQTQDFRENFVHHTENIVIIPVLRHWMIHHVDMNRPRVEGGPLLRDVVAQAQWQAQWWAGLHLLTHRGVLADGGYR